MPSNFTEHFQLNQWEPGDQVKREDFNADNRKIDAAVNARTRMVVGSYKGTGKYGPDNPNVIEIADAERPPQVIVVLDERGFYRAVLVRGMRQYCVYLANNQGHWINVTWTDKGASWYSTEAGYYQLNNSEQGYNNFYYAVFI